jgi:hypothetical protein
VIAVLVGIILKMNTLKTLIRNLSVTLYGTSVLNEIIEQGFVPLETGEEARHLPEDWELYAKGNERIMYNGRTDEVIDRYDLTNVRR